MHRSIAALLVALSVMSAACSGGGDRRPSLDRSSADGGAAAGDEVDLDGDGVPEDPEAAAAAGGSAGRSGGRGAAGGGRQAGAKGRAVAGEARRAGFATTEDAPPLPTPRTEVAGASFGGKIAVIGGMLADGAASAAFDVYDPATRTWSAGPALPVAVHHAGAVELGGRLYVVGGFTNAAGQPPKAVTQVVSIAPGEPDWRGEIPLPEPRGALTLVADRGSLLVIGGVTSGPARSTLRHDPPAVARSAEQTSATTTEQRRDDDDQSRDREREGDDGAKAERQRRTRSAPSDSWAAGPELEQPREHLAALVVGGVVHAIGGRAGGLETNRRSTEILESGATSWGDGADLVDARGGIAAASDGTRACVVGGEATSGTIATIECLVGGGSRWERVARLEHPRHGLAVVFVGGALHVIAGGPQPGLTVSGTHEVVTDLPSVRSGSGS